MTRTEGSRSFLVLLRAGVQGEAEETMAEMRNRVFAEAEKADEKAKEASTSESSHARSGSDVRRTDLKPLDFGLGAEGRAQAQALGVELSSVLCGFGITTARLMFPKSSKPSEQTCELISTQLEDAHALGERVMSCSTATEPCLGSPDDGDLLLAAANVKRFAQESTHPEPLVLILVSNDSQLLIEVADVVTSAKKVSDGNTEKAADDTTVTPKTLPFTDPDAKTFEHGCGVLLESTGEDKPWTLRRTLSHD